MSLTVKNFDNIICVIAECEDLRILKNIDFKVSLMKKSQTIDCRDYCKKYNNEKIDEIELTEKEAFKNMNISNIYYHEKDKNINYIMFLMRYQSSTPSTTKLTIEGVKNIFAFESYAFCSHLLEFRNEDNKNAVTAILGETYKNYYQKDFKIINFKEYRF